MTASSCCPPVTIRPVGSNRGSSRRRDESRRTGRGPRRSPYRSHDSQVVRPGGDPWTVNVNVRYGRNCRLEKVSPTELLPLQGSAAADEIGMRLPAAPRERTGQTRPLTRPRQSLGMVVPPDEQLATDRAEENELGPPAVTQYRVPPERQGPFGPAGLQNRLRRPVNRRLGQIRLRRRSVTRNFSRIRPRKARAQHRRRRPGINGEAVGVTLCSREFGSPAAASAYMRWLYW